MAKVKKSHGIVRNNSYSAVVEEASKHDTFAKVVGVDSLRVRREPSFDGAVIGHAKKDSILKVLAKPNEDFYQIVSEAGLEGYCSGQYLLVYEEGEYKEV